MRKYKMWTLLIVLSLLAACKQPQSLTPSVSEVAQIKANGCLLYTSDAADE